MTHEYVKLGKLNKKVLDHLPEYVDFNPFVYIPERILSTLVERYPNDYLAKVKDLSSILHHPDFYGVKEKEKEIYFVRFFYRRGFKNIGFKLHFHHQWQLEKIFSIKEKDAGFDVDFIRF